MTAKDTQIKVSGQDAKFVLDITRPLGPRQTAKITGLLTGQGAVRRIDIDVAKNDQGQAGFEKADMDALHTLVGTIRLGMRVDVFLIVPRTDTAPPQLAAWSSAGGNLVGRTAIECRALPLNGEDVDQLRYLDAWPVRV